MKYVLPEKSEAKLLVGGRVKVTHANGNVESYANEEAFKAKYDTKVALKAPSFSEPVPLKKVLEAPASENPLAKKADK